MKQKWLITTATGTLTLNSHQHLRTGIIELDTGLTPVNWFLHERLEYHDYPEGLVLINFWKID